MDYYNYILKDSEKRLERSIKKQIKDNQNSNFGAIDDDFSYPEAKPTAYCIGTAISLYVNKESKYYLSDTAYNFIFPAIKYVASRQREDGTFDLENCNFQSAADTGFLIQPLILSYKLLNKENSNKNIEIFKEMLYDIIYKAIDGMVIGGFHTPNHRWAIASIMAYCLGFIKNDKLRGYIDQYLNEGIDCNEDGEYAERSAATYNVVNDNAMLLLYEGLGERKYLDYALKNIEMMLTYIEPDGSIFTDNSTRQDKGKKHYPRDYFYHYLYAAYETGREDFSSAANKIITDMYERKQDLAPDCLGRLMLHGNLKNLELKGYGFPEKYNRFFKSSGLVRIKNGNYSCSIIKDSTKTLVFQSGATAVYLKIGVSYFDKRNFVAQTIEEKDGTYTLTFKADGWYYLPFSEKQQTSDWWAMDNDKREKMIKNTVTFTANLTPKEDGVDFHVASSGCDRVKVTFEIGVPPTSLIETNSFFIHGQEGAAIVVKEGMVNIKNNGDKLKIGPAFAKHKFIEGKFGSEERSLYSQTIYFTEETNFERTISFKVDNN